MRTSSDIYILPSGTLVSLNQMQTPPSNAKLYQGFNYAKQIWIRNGAEDKRTLEELKEDIKKDSEGMS